MKPRYLVKYKDETDEIIYHGEVIYSYVKQDGTLEFRDEEDGETFLSIASDLWRTVAEYGWVEKVLAHYESLEEKDGGQEETVALHERGGG